MNDQHISYHIKKLIKNISETLQLLVLPRTRVSDPKLLSNSKRYLEQKEYKIGKDLYLTCNRYTISSKYIGTKIQGMYP